MSGIIRKISLGIDPLNGNMVFERGKPAGRLKDWHISNITEDINNYYQFGITRYSVYVKNGDIEIKWKAFERIPVAIEYYLDTEQGVIV